MNYVNIVNLIFLVVGFIFLLYLFHYFFFGISSLVYRKKYPVSEEKCRYCVVVSCKDEENVIGRLIESIKSSDYPQEKLDILIIAHNRKDKTAEIATDFVFNGEPIRFCNDAALLFPLFFGLQLPLDIAALFKRNVTWVKIPHGDK